MMRELDHNELELVGGCGPFADTFDSFVADVQLEARAFAKAFCDGVHDGQNGG